MAEKKTTPVVINGKQYTLEDLTAEQQELVEHVADLERKMRSASFNMRQLEGGRKHFMDMLNESLENTATDVAAE